MNVTVETTRLLTALALVGLAVPLAADVRIGCQEGCTPGYWKNHPERWDGVGDDDYTQTVFHPQPFNATFGVDFSFSGLVDSATLLEAAAQGGGAPANLNRHAAAGLASADAGICYAYTITEVIEIYRDGIGADAGSLSLEDAKSLLETANEAGCPLGNEPPGGFTPYCFGDGADCPCANDVPGPNSGCINSTGGGGWIERSAGTRSVTLDDLELTSYGLPANEFALTFMGIAQVRTTFGDGLRCVGAGGLKVFRYLPATATDANGTMTLGPGVVAYSAANHPPFGFIEAGDTWNFQTWYRDPVGPCNAGFNLTSALQVEFVP